MLLDPEPINEEPRYHSEYRDKWETYETKNKEF